jgi:phosphatidate phosphatase APP1
VGDEDRSAAQIGARPVVAVGADQLPDRVVRRARRPDGVIVRGRVLNNPEPSSASEGEGVGAALRRSVQNFTTRELPGVPLTVEVGGHSAGSVSDDDGYFVVRLPAAPHLGPPWAAGAVSLRGSYRGLTTAPVASVAVRVPDGAAALYRDLAAPVNPVFYVSSSPWNLHAFLTAFLAHHDFPRGPRLLRDLLGTAAGREQKHGRIREILDLHPDLPFVLIGDSGEKDPEIYADIVRSHPGRILAVCIREVRLDAGDGMVEEIAQSWAPDVPFVLAGDSDVVRRHAETLGLL